jgi:hypothetical protein
MGLIEKKINKVFFLKQKGRTAGLTRRGWDAL